MRLQVKAVGTTLTVLFLLSGCGTQAAASAGTTTRNAASSNTSNATGSGAANHVTNITFWSGHPSGKLHKAILAEVSKFNSTHQNIHVTIDIIHATNKAIPAYLAHKAPNVAEIQTAAVQKFVTANAVVNLKPFINGSNGLSQQEIKKRYYPVIWNDMQGPGKKQYLMPLEKKSFVVVYYNDALFKKAHISGAPKTWSQYFSDVQKISQLGGKVHGWAWTPMLPVFFSMVKDYGGNIWANSNHSKFSLDSAAGKKVLSQLRSLVKSGDLLITKKYEYQQDFGTGKIGLLTDASAGWTYDYGSVGGKFPMLAAPAPKGTAPIAYNWINGGSLTMMNTGTSAQKAAAWTFMKWMSSPSTNTYWNEHTNYLPLGPQTDSNMQSFYQKNKPYAASFSNPKGWTMKPRFVNYTQAETTMMNYFLKGLNGQLSVNQALQGMDKSGDKYMSGHRRL
ncbi:extracellular solute-binding protein [Alicyclobacillus sp. SO9]|uniref:extracellular solute-binding protein n=1 Tax=Alicyclobacillus sp. SO9 TaxID=2665646 RepID=UPI0018E78E5E|nr:extracellular solute-binding protein [Alicyclobacillus sp. SO9]QQE79152.1 extracellular solute-binding protein [Alicyclobacillus sp. SO9]